MNILFHIGLIVFLILFLNGLEDAQKNWTHVPGYKYPDEGSITFPFGDRVITISYERKHMYHNLLCMIKHKIKR